MKYSNLRSNVCSFAIVACFLSPLLLSKAAFSQEEATAPAVSDVQDYSGNLTGDLGGVRSKMYTRGIDLQAVYTADVFDNVSGGIEGGAVFMDNLDITAEIDGSKLYGIQGSKIFFYLLNNNGSRFNEKRVGSNDGIDNIEVGTRAFKLYEAWIEQNLWDDKFSFRAGLYDLNSEFDVTDSSGIFLNPTFGIDTAYAGTGENGPSIFPVTSLAARINIAPVDNFYIRAAVLDGVPGDIDDPKGTHINFDENDGALVALETGYGDLGMGRVAVGGWWYSEKSDHLTDVDGSGNPVRENSDGFYGVAEKTLYSPDGSEGRHLDAFVRFAMADDSVNQFDYSGSFGLAYTGPFQGRNDDVAGIAFHGAHNGDPFRDAQDTSGEPVLSGEWGVEATYSIQVMPWLRVQPDLQYIKDPGANPDIDDVVSAGLRVEFNL